MQGLILKLDNLVKNILDVVSKFKGRVNDISQVFPAMQLFNSQEGIEKGHINKYIYIE